MKVLEINSSKETFRSVRLNTDNNFNMVIAERTRESKSKDSRNGLGKTTLINIVDFCLGANLNSSLKKEELENVVFSVKVELGEKVYTFLRNTSSPNEIEGEGDFSDWLTKPNLAENGHSVFKAKDFNVSMGKLLFGVTEKLSETFSYHPSYRSLISYFIRTGTGSFDEPFRHFSRQSSSDVQINNSYLLGLDWEYSSELQLIKDDEKTLSGLKKAASSGLLENYFGSLGELDAERVRLEETINKVGKQISSFVVHPQYYEIQKEADAITGQTHSLLNTINLNEQLSKKYQEDDSEDFSFQKEEIERIFKQAGAVFSSGTVRKFEEIETFHKDIVKNRRDYLSSEIKKLSDKIVEDKEQVEKLTKDKAKLMSILQTQGALDEYSKLQERSNSLNQRLSEINQRIANLKKFNDGVGDLRIRKEELLKGMRRDFDDRKPNRDRAISIFNANSEYLYEEPGLLSIETTDFGYKFDVEIKRAGSQGISNMKIFCYDLMLAELWSRFNDGKPFLIHDSTIFDGVDERQVAKALELAEKKSNEFGFQYICTMNSDAIPKKELSEEFGNKLDKSVVLTLTDSDETGCLLGKRF